MTYAQKHPNHNVCIVEASDQPGGRVRSDITDDGFILDRGFAVFIENYPMSREIFDYRSLGLTKFDPGSFIKLPNRSHLARVADPIRQPNRLLDALVSPVGTWVDKIRLIPLLLNVKFKSIEELFDEEEVDTLSCLRTRYYFSEKMITEFFTPFLEGIYLCSLDEQSSRMFHFVFKMFSDGAATLPTGGMQVVSNQLAEKAKNTFGVDLRLNYNVKNLSCETDYYTISSSASSLTTFTAKKVICATEYPAAKRLLSTLEGLDVMLDHQETQGQKSVAGMYYSFKGDAPITEPILILNGEGKGVINNVSFPSVVNDSYSPPGHSLCSVALTRSTMTLYRGREDDLDKEVRAQLAEWFEDYREDIMTNWERKGKVYEIAYAQPSQLGGSFPANVHQGRECNKFGTVDLPQGLFICGDHMVSYSITTRTCKLQLVCLP